MKVYQETFSVDLATLAAVDYVLLGSFKYSSVIHVFIEYPDLSSYDCEVALVDKTSDNTNFVDIPPLSAVLSEAGGIERLLLLKDYIGDQVGVKITKNSVAAGTITITYIAKEYEQHY
jgi:hypothetical protein